MLTRLLLAGALLGSAAPVAHRALVRPDPEEAAVRAALEHYLQGHATGLGSEFQQGMHPQGTMYFVRDGALVTRSFPDYIAGAPGKLHAGVELYLHKFTDFTGKAQTVVAPQAMVQWTPFTQFVP